MDAPNENSHHDARRRTPRWRWSRRCRVAFADDDLDTRVMIAEALRDEGCEVSEVSGGAELLNHLALQLSHGAATLPDLILTDMAMPGCTGLDVLAWLRTLDHSPPCVVITGYGSDEVRLLAAELGAAAVLEKPVDLDLLERLVHRLTLE